jgi:hypothetical protein
VKDETLEDALLTVERVLANRLRVEPKIRAVIADAVASAGVGGPSAEDFSGAALSLVIIQLAAGGADHLGIAAALLSINSLALMTSTETPELHYGMEAGTLVVSAGAWS